MVTRKQVRGLRMYAEDLQEWGGGEVGVVEVILLLFVMTGSRWEKRSC